MKVFVRTDNLDSFELRVFLIDFGFLNIHNELFKNGKSVTTIYNVFEIDCARLTWNKLPEAAPKSIDLTAMYLSSDNPKVGLNFVHTGTQPTLVDIETITDDFAIVKSDGVNPFTKAVKVSGSSFLEVSPFWRMRATLGDTIFLSVINEVLDSGFLPTKAHRLES